MSQVEVAAQRVAALDEAINRVDAIDVDESFFGVELALEVLEVLRDLEYEKVKVQENIVVNYSK